MAFALVGSLGAVTGPGASPRTPAFGQATTAGNLLVAWVIGNNPTTSATGWVKAADSSSACTVWYKANCGAGETAPTFTDSGGTGLIAMLGEFSGGATSSPLDQQVGSGTSGTSPRVATMPAADVSSGELIIGNGQISLSKSGTDTTTHTYNNGATATGNVNNDATSTIFHYRFSYGITTGNASADTLTLTDTSMNLSGLDVAIASFKLFTASARVPRSPGVDSGNAHL